MEMAMTRARLTARISRSLRLTCFFGAFVFLQFTVLGLANHAGEGYLTPVQRDRVYYALQAFVILGYLLHALAVRREKGKRFRNIAGGGAFGMLFACAAAMLLTGTGSLLSVVVSMAAALCLGGIGGAMHLRMSLETASGADTARCMGVGSAAAVALQYFLQIRWNVVPLLAVFMGASLLGIASFLRSPCPQTDGEGKETPEKTPARRLVSCGLIAAVFILFTCFYNETIHHLMMSSGYTAVNVYSWPRLMLIPGYLLFAGIGGLKKGKYVPVASLCIMLVALLNVVLVGDAGTYSLNMCLFYLAIAAFTSYYLLTFWRLAPGTRRPAFWAPFGRMLDSAMVLLTGAVRLSSFPAPVVLGADIAGAVLVILLMSTGGDFALNETAPDQAREAPKEIQEAAGETADETAGKTTGETTGAQDIPWLLSQEETLAAMRETYRLTPRETEVLRELVLTEDKQAVLSQRLSIQVKTLQDYVTRLYRKTGASSRLGLKALYDRSRIRS